jgi:two-component system, NtrC family, sensor kinase
LVTCLAGQLNQVFMNLIVNASHAIAATGTITLASGAVDGWVWVQVDDTGCGMTDEVMRRIFEPFYTTKEVGKGTGLGLSLSFSIVQRHGGAIQVRSHPRRGQPASASGCRWPGPQPAGSPTVPPPAWT